MSASPYLYLNGGIIPATDFSIGPDHRGLRYGDGLFETMKVLDGVIQLERFHLERLFDSLKILGIQIPEYFSANHIREEAALLLKKNGHTASARLRLMVCRAEGGLYEVQAGEPTILMQSWPLQTEANKVLSIDVFPDARKSVDVFSNLKSNNYLCYVMGAIFAAKKSLDDVLILNAHGRIADATIANVFIVKDGKIITPPLNEGCINGVYRRFLLGRFTREGILYRERPVSVETLLSADEVFLTNAITGIRSVKSCGSAQYGNRQTLQLINIFS